MGLRSLWDNLLLEDVEEPKRSPASAVDIYSSDTGINELEKMRDTLQKKPLQEDLTPLFGIVAALTGKDYSGFYRKPESETQREDRLIKISEAISKRQAAKNQQEAMIEAVKEKNKSAIEQSKARLALTSLLANQKNETRSADRQKDVLKTDEAKGIRAGIDFADALDKYKAALEGQTEFYGPQAEAIETMYSDLKIKAKEAANLGALTGPDMQILTEQLKPQTGNAGAARALFSKMGLAGGKEGALGSIGQLKQRTLDKIARDRESLTAVFGEAPLLKQYDKQLGSGSEDKKKRLEELRAKKAAGTLGK